MIKSFINILSIALIYCGTVFGAGFASGQEIATFFSCYNLCGIAASVFAGFLFSFFGYIICKKAWHYNLGSAGDFFCLIFPKAMSKFLNFVCTSFLVVCFCIMIAGCGALFMEQFSVRPIFGSFLSIMICYMITKNKVRGLAWFNSAVTPLMIVGIVVLCIMCLKPYKTNFAASDMKNIWGAAFSAVLYLSYNLMSATAVLVPSTKIAKTELGAGIGGAVGGVFIAVPLVLMSLVLSENPKFYISQLPFFSLVCEKFPVMQIFCSLILYFAMLTTATSAGVSVIAKVKERYSGKYAVILCTVAFFASFIPFNILVKSMYTIFGICGLILLVGILKSFLRKK